MFRCISHYMFDKSNFDSNCNNLSQTLIGIHPTECWKYGYECSKETYDVSTAVMYYILSSIRFIDDKYRALKILWEDLNVGENLSNALNKK